MVLKDQVALVTGGGAGIGEATARLLAENGAAVMVADWNEDSARATAAAIVKAGGKAAHARCDVSQPPQARLAVEATVESFRRIDVLINNAGITRDSSALKMAPEQWEQVLGVNLSGVFHCSVAESLEICVTALERALLLLRVVFAVCAPVTEVRFGRRRRSEGLEFPMSPEFHSPRQRGRFRRSTRGAPDCPA